MPKPLAKTITYYRAAKALLSTDCIHDCDTCPLPDRKSPPLPSKRALQSLLRKVRRRDIHVLEIVAGERAWELESIQKNLKYYGMNSFNDYVAMMRGLIDDVNAEQSGEMYPAWNAGPLTATEMRLWRSTLMAARLSIDPSDPMLWRDGALRNSPRRKFKDRMKALQTLGKANIPTTVVLNVGMGEAATYREHTVRAILEAHQKDEHIQSVEIMPVRPRSDAELTLEPLSDAHLLEIIDMCRSVLPREITLQYRPLTHLKILPDIIEAGVRDFGPFYFTSSTARNAEVEFLHHQIERYVVRKDFRFRERIPIFDRYIERGWFPETYLKPVARFIKRRERTYLDAGKLKKAIPTPAPNS